MVTSLWCCQQPDADNGDIVVAGIPGDEATVKTFSRRDGPASSSRLPTPALNRWCSTAAMSSIFGKVVTIVRQV